MFEIYTLHWSRLKVGLGPSLDLILYAPQCGYSVVSRGCFRMIIYSSRVVMLLNQARIFTLKRIGSLMYFKGEFYSFMLCLLLASTHLKGLSVKLFCTGIWYNYL